MKKTSILAILAIAILVTACPYSSEVPLSTPGEKIPQQLIGKWLSPSDAEKEEENKKMMPEYRKKLTPTFYVISGIDKNSMKIEKHEFQSSDSSYSVKLNTAHVTTIGGVKFLNVKPNDENKYYFYKMVFPAGNKLELYPVSDYIKETFTDSKSIYSFFGKYKELSFFYSSKEEYQKVTKGR